MSPVQVRTKRLGQILVESGAITPEKLDLALREQKQTGEKLGAVLQRLGICSEREIAKVLASQAGVECVDLARFEIGPEVLALVPREYAETKSLLPLRLRGSTLQVAMANPLDMATTDELGRLTGRYIEVVHAPESEIKDAQVRHFGGATGAEDDIPQLVAAARRSLEAGGNPGQEDSPYIRLVDGLLRQGVQEGATDIHIEPEEKVLRCRYRIDGRLVQGAVLPSDLLPIVVTRIKIMAEMNISENRVPQDGRIFFDSGRKKVDMRVSTFPTVHGETIVCRILDKESLIVGLDRLHMPEAMLADFRRDITRPNGIILVTGPTGSGKTTTLYSALTFLNKPDTKIITLEDPVEYELPIINQAQVNNAKGFTFATGLRAVLRQDPDILLVGEIRDVETAQLAIRAALTGHLVFSTLHTNSAAGAIPRLLDMGIEPLLLSATLVSVVAQRLVRRVCDACAQPVTPDPELTALLNLGADDLDGARPRQGRGCSLCRQSGYRGRLAVFEYLSVDDNLRRLIVERRDVSEIEHVARTGGSCLLRDDAVAKFRSGVTTLAEVMRVAS